MRRTPPPTLVGWALAFVCLGLGAVAQAEETLEQQRDQKLQAEFLKKAAWFTDYDKALAKSKSSGKLILAYLTRSYSP